MNRFALGFALTAGLAITTTAHADYTGQVSAGGSYVFGGDAGRGPLTFEIGPGYQMTMLRIEVPLVFAAGGDNTFPPTTSAFMGARPSAKLFFWDPFYAKICTQIFWSGDGYYGIGFGGGAEYMLMDLLGAFAEITVNPYFGDNAGTPLEGRLGVTLKI